MFSKIKVTAPPGKLGIHVVDNRTNQVRNVISEVGEYSPLAGNVFPGDQIVTLNGVDSEAK